MNHLGDSPPGIEVDVRLSGGAFLDCIEDAAGARSEIDRPRLPLPAALDIALDPRRLLRMLHEPRRGRGCSEPRCRQHVVLETVGRCHALEEVPLAEVEARLGSAPREADPRVRTLERQLLLPWLISVGETERA